MAGDVNIELGVDKIVKDVFNRIGKLLKYFQMSRQDKEKTVVQFKKELYNVLNITGSLYRGGKLDTIKVNDKTFGNQLAKAKTDAMEKVMDSQRQYAKKLAKKDNAFFVRLSIALSKLNSLKMLNATPDKELALLQPVRIKVRVKNIFNAFAALAKA